jgi:hypothetical protein
LEVLDFPQLKQFVMWMKRFFGGISLILLASTFAFAHPGSGIVIDKDGNVYITDTGKGVWKISPSGKLSFIEAPQFHWMSIDPTGRFSGVSNSFGNHFERVSPAGTRPALIMCSDFPLVIGNDGNLYYVNTQRHAGKIIRRSPTGEETVLAQDPIFESVGGIAVGNDGALYVTDTNNPETTAIRKITMSGAISVIASYIGKNGSDSQLETQRSYCRGLFVDSSGIIYIAATGSRSVLRKTPNGSVTTILETNSPWTPTAVAVFQGEVYILEWHDVPADQMEVRSAWIPRVRKIARNGRVITLATISR